MRSLASKPNVIAPGGDYPHGRIKDDPGNNTGTPVDEEVYGDFHQFFSELMAAGGVVPNGLPENDYSGFQLNEALENIIQDIVDVLDADLQAQIDEFAPTAWANIPLINGWTAIQTPQWKKIKNQVFLRGQVVGTLASDAAMCAAASVPNDNAYNLGLTAHRLTPTVTVEGIDVAISTAGAITSSDRANSTILYLDGLSYWSEG